MCPPDDDEIIEAHRVAKDLQQQAIDATGRTITGRDPEGRVRPPSSVDMRTSREASRLEQHIAKKYGNAVAKDYSSAGDMSSYDLRDKPLTRGQSFYQPGKAPPTGRSLRDAVKHNK